MALTNKQLKAVEMLVYTTKQKQEIAEELKVSRGTVSQWIKKEEFQQAITDEMKRGFVDIAYKARRRLSELVDSPNEQVALGAIKEALNKAGYQETQKIEQTVREINIEITE